MKGRVAPTPRGSRVAVMLLALAVVCGAVAAGAADRTLSVYEPRHRPAEELLPLARAGLGERGQAMLDAGTNSLLLVGPEGALAETVELLERLDRAPRTVVLRYASQRLDSLAARGIGVEWNVEAGDVRVGNVRVPAGEEGLRVQGFSVGTELEGGLGGVLRILEGRSGRIVTGRTVPVARRSRFDVDLAFVTAESGFEARPRILADGRVHVELMPMEADVNARGRVRFTGASTVVTVRPGETVAVGGIDRTNDVRREGGRVYEANQRADRERVLLLRVEIEDAPEATRPASPARRP